MSRKLPKDWIDDQGHAKAPPELTPKADGRITQVREYELITPLFGGGVEPGIADPVTVVRATEVRGQLRFWWRATRGGQFGGSLEEMKKAEDAIWGSSASFDKEGKLQGGPSQVQIQVTEVEIGDQDAPFEVVRGNNGKKKIQARSGSTVPAYAAFPLQPSEKEAYIGKPVSTDIRFTLSISFLKIYTDDIEAALWAWETFGGLGARTRRGFGALSCLRVNRKAAERPKLQQARAWIEDKLKEHIPEYSQWHSDVPHLTRTTRVVIEVEADADASQAWKHLIDKLQSFRQARAKNKYGSTLWPDANAVRRATKSTVGSNHFPRAAFGLPIVFHFKDPSEPEDTSLQTDQHDRLASPLILRPLRCANEKNQQHFVGIGLVLDGTALPPGQLQLVATKDRSRAWPVDGVTLTQTQANAIVTPDPGNKPIINDASQPDGTIDVLRAFLNYLERK